MLVQVPKDVPPRSLDVILDPYFIRVAHRHMCVPVCYLGSAIADADAMRQPGSSGLLSAPCACLCMWQLHFDRGSRLTILPRCPAHQLQITRRL